MKYKEYKHLIINNELNSFKEKLRRFNIKPVEVDSKNELFWQNNVIATVNESLILESLNKNKELNIIIGYKNKYLNLAHFTILKEVLFLIRNNNKAKIIFVNLNNNDNEFIESFIELLNSKTQKKVNYEVITKSYLNQNNILEQIAECLKIKEIRRIMGFNENQVASQYLSVLNMVATFLINNYINKECLILADMNQVTYYELAKKVAKQRNLTLPAFTFHMFFPNLKRKGRMSNRDPDNAIFISDSPSLKLKKIMSCYTGELKDCVLLRIMDLVYTKTELEKEITSCGYCCLDCKKRNSHTIINRI